MPFTLPPDANGILPDRMIAAMADAGLILPEYPFVESQIQPASLDLRLGNIAYRVRATNNARNLVYPFYVIPEEDAE